MIESSRRSLAPEQWVSNYADLLYRYVYIRIADKNLAEDIVQETFLSAWRSRSTYDRSSSEKNWLFTICKNKLIDHFRNLKAVKISRDTHYFDNYDHWTQEAGPVEWPNLQALEGQEFLNVLNQCRSKLKEQQSAVFTLRYLDQLEAKEVCNLMKITAANYWVLLHRAKLQLRECLQLNWINQQK